MSQLITIDPVTRIEGHLRIDLEVEGGVVKTGTVRLGHNVTIGIGSIVDIDVEVDSNCQIGAFSLVPKHTKLKGPAVYTGIPVQRIR